jgi:hypothetical protein
MLDCVLRSHARTRDDDEVVEEDDAEPGRLADGEWRRRHVHRICSLFVFCVGFQDFLIITVCLDFKLRWLAGEAGVRNTRCILARSRDSCRFAFCSKCVPTNASSRTRNAQQPRLVRDGILVLFTCLTAVCVGTNKRMHEWLCCRTGSSNRTEQTHR